MLNTSLLVMLLAVAMVAEERHRFGDYPVSKYQGPIRPPDWIDLRDGDVARDDLGKIVGQPSVNFAGKYFVALHSCGTSCRYYTLTDLSTGRDLKALDMFAAAEPAPRTREGHPYITFLEYQSTSRLLVAHYYVQVTLDKEECRERLFVFEAGKVRPITETKRICEE